MSVQTHIDSPKRFASRLRKARTATGLSQREISFKGCSAVYVCRMEKAQRVPSLQVLREVALRLGVSEEWLARGEGPKEPPVMLALDSAMIDHCLRRVSEGHHGLGDLTAEERERFEKALAWEAEELAVPVAVRIFSSRSICA